MKSFIIRRRDGSEHQVLVDAEDYDRVMEAGPWHVYREEGRTSFYAIRNVKVGNKRRSQSLQRFVTNEPDGIVDHENGRGLDNRKRNLRVCSYGQNNSNIPARATNTSGYKNVSWHSSAKKWFVKVTHGGKQKSFGFFDDIEDANRAAIAARSSLHGTFACGTQRSKA